MLYEWLTHQSSKAMPSVTLVMLLSLCLCSGDIYALISSHSYALHHFTSSQEKDDHNTIHYGDGDSIQMAFITSDCSDDSISLIVDVRFNLTTSKVKGYRRVCEDLVYLKLVLSRV